MNHIQNYNGPKATVCADKNCITVYDEAAQIINMIAVLLAIAIAVLVITKIAK